MMILIPVLARTFSRGLIIGLALLIATIATNAQNSTTSATDGRTPSGIQAGSPAGSYELSGFDNINLFNGNLNFRMPLVGVGGRGSAAFAMMLALNLKSWHVKHFHKVMPDESEIDSYSPTQNGWVPYGGYGPGAIGGRNYGLQTSSNFSCRWYSKTLSRLTFSTADGTEYELRDQLSGGQPLNSTCTQGAYRGTVFITADGSAATFISDTPIYDNPAINIVGPHGFSVSGYLMLRDGTHFRVDNSSVTWIRDRNGNKLSFTYDVYGRVLTVTDALNRTVTVNYDVNDVAPYGLCDQIIYKGFGGAQRIIRVSHTTLENVLRPNSGYSIKTLGGPNGLFPELNGASTSTTFNPTETSNVWLPDGRSLKFYYNSYGELARVELPTGGAVEYDVTPGSGVVFACQFCDEPQIYRRVIERRVYPDGSTGSTFEHREIYTNSEAVGTPSSIVTVEHRAADGSVLTRSRHYFDGSALDSIFVGDVSSPYGAWYEGNERQTEELATFGSIETATVLRRTSITRVQRAPVSWWASYAATYGLDATKEPPNDPRVTERTITLLDTNQVSKHSFSYDDSVPYNNQSDVYEYDFGIGAAGALIRRTHTDYVTITSYTDASTGAHLRSLPAQTSVYDSSGVQRALSTFEYDNYAADANHAALVDRPGISGFDSTFTTAYTTRGNVTATTNYLLLDGTVTGSVSAFAQYDIAGNAVKAIDARGYASIFDFSDRFGAPDGEARANNGAAELGGQVSYAFPTLVTNALGHTAYLQFDYYLGRAVDGEDANGVVASAYFNDLLDRPTKVVRANGVNGLQNQSVFAYDDANHTITTSSDLNTNADGLLVGKVLYDGLGRTLESRQYEGGSNYIVVQTQYDALGRPYKVSNPFRPWNGETAVWTTSAFDDLGRLMSVTSPDNAVISNSYSGNSATVIDQAGKQRKSVSDALGRLKEVYEDPAGLNYVTSYSYDALNNLTTITQGAQTRTFVYDSLKRLTSASNPENGTVSYQYDNNGNLTQKTDARLVVTSFIYDALNRVTTKLYRINGQPDPNTGDVEYLYDNAANGKGRPWLTFTWGAHPFQTAVGGYDALGRVTQLYHLFGNGQGGWYPAYGINATYDLVGHVKSMTYPSGRNVTNSFDNAGRLNSFTGNLGDGTTRTYSNTISYSSFGGLTQEQFGTQTSLYHKLHYNVRGQLYDVRVSTLSLTQNEFDWNRGCLALYYGVYGWGQSGPGNNGNIAGIQHWVPADEGYGNYWYTQDNYGYDSLNRISSASEVHGGPWGQSGTDYVQVYDYDRYGNRTVDQVNTWGAVPKPNFGVSGATNQLSAPAGYSMNYDQAGNLTYDTYTGEGTRTYDAENRMKQVWANSQWQTYAYDGDGARIKRIVNQTETWQVYGLGGELIAEYAPTASPSSPQKEYGYRNGELLVTAEPNANIHWLVPDQLGTPRMVFDQMGSLANVSRHDYLPFGEELSAGVGGRTTAQGYSGDNVRQKFTGQERDAETGLDYMHARYYASGQGRFTGADPLIGSLINPQSLNRYTYVSNNPLRYIDPSGLFQVHFPANIDPHSHTGEGEAAEAEFDQRVQNTRDAVAATDAARNGDWDRVNELMQNNATLEYEGASASGDDTGFGEVLSMERNTTEHYCDVYQEPEHQLISSEMNGIVSDVTTAIVGYSAAPTAEPPGSQQPKYGLYAGDDRGHIIGQALGGPPVSDNLFSQHPSINRGAYRDFERDIRKVLTKHHDWVALIKVTLVYQAPPPNTFPCTKNPERYLRPLGETYSVSYMERYTNKAKAVGTPASKWFSN